MRVKAPFGVSNTCSQSRPLFPNAEGTTWTITTTTGAEHETAHFARERHHKSFVMFWIL